MFKGYKIISIVEYRISKRHIGLKLAFLSLISKKESN